MRRIFLFSMTLASIGCGKEDKRSQTPTPSSNDSGSSPVKTTTTSKKEGEVKKNSSVKNDVVVKDMGPLTPHPPGSLLALQDEMNAFARGKRLVYEKNEINSPTGKIVSCIDFDATKSDKCVWHTARIYIDLQGKQSRLESSDELARCGFSVDDKPLYQSSVSNLDISLRYDRSDDTEGARYPGSMINFIEPLPNKIGEIRQVRIDYRADVETISAIDLEFRPLGGACTPIVKK